MRLLLTFLICLLIGQSLSVGLGLLVERYSTPYTGLVSFITSYFAMFWLAWRVAVHRTAPAPGGGRSRAGVSGGATVCTGRYCWLGEPRMENSGSVSPNAAPFFPAATPTS